MKPDETKCTAQSAATGLVTGALLTLEDEGAEFCFMVDTGAMVSIIQPGISEAQLRTCDVQARDVTGTQLDILGEQDVQLSLYGNRERKTFVHTFVVGHLNRCSSGILCMDFLQREGAEISLTSPTFTVGLCSFPLRSWAGRLNGSAPDQR